MLHMIMDAEKYTFLIPEDLNIKTIIIKIKKDNSTRVNCYKKTNKLKSTLAQAVCSTAA